MNSLLLFPIAMAILDLGAAYMCWMDGQKWMAATWIWYACAAITLGMASVSK